MGMTIEAVFDDVWWVNFEPSVGSEIRKVRERSFRSTEEPRSALYRPPRRSTRQAILTAISRTGYRPPADHLFSWAFRICCNIGSNSLNQSAVGSCQFAPPA
jgi:hypothetical protein